MHAQASGSGINSLLLAAFAKKKNKKKRKTSIWSSETTKSAVNCILSTSMLSRISRMQLQHATLSGRHSRLHLHILADKKNLSANPKSVNCGLSLDCFGRLFAFVCLFKIVSSDNAERTVEASWLGWMTNATKQPWSSAVSACWTTTNLNCFAHGVLAWKLCVTSRV